MNKETNAIIKALEENTKLKQKIRDLRSQNSNYKDFYILCNYVVVELVNTDKRFFNMSRDKIDLEFISNMYFWN